MRRSAVLLVLLTASACGEGGNREAVIKAGVETCTREFEAGAADRPGTVPEGIEGERICTCAMERLSEGKSATEIRRISIGREPTQEQVEVIGACVVEEARRVGVLAR